MTQKPKFQIWWDQETGVIRNKARGDFNEQEAQKQADLFLTLINERSGKVLVLHDLTEGKIASSKARKIYAALMKEEKIKKQAFVGISSMTRVIVSFITNFSGVNNARYFNTEKEALEWLKND